ncbi:Hemicentin-1 [Orchesella cincta]|uniref:Hemicentin-1 n=1 Tax=Orchesella cincta TaxID=48709 RepID=A0A1D2NBS1_ORCCI|nr:Hemicentin-1 [Orchesella cincta]
MPRANTQGGDEESGPVFVKEPPSKVDFSNSTGAEIPCQARGTPQPEIIWLRADGTAVGDVPGLRQVLASGALVFPPFRAEDYRQEVHAQTYICLARNSVGTIHSRDVHVRAVVSQSYTANVWEEHVIRGNSALVKCNLPAFVGDFVSVSSWYQDDSQIEKNDVYVVNQPYSAKVFEEDVIRGNAAIFKCSTPTFVVVNQPYSANVFQEDVIRGNAAIFKCSTPTFVGDFLNVDSWFQDDKYEVDPIKEHAIKGNNAIVKCQVPSYVADFLTRNVIQIIIRTTLYIFPVVSQQFMIEVHNEHVIRGNSVTLRCNIPAFVADFLSVTSWGNSGILKCEMPSFVADFLQIVAWVDESENSYVYSSKANHVVAQHYASEIVSEYVIRGNNAVLKCNIPAFVADFVYNTYGDQEDIIRGNSAILKCKIPSFVSDFLSVVAWHDDIGNVYSPENVFVVTQAYDTYGDQEHIIRGNSAILKCRIPSFVADFLEITAWVDDEGSEYIIRGNSGVLKCKIPSFVADYLEVVSWHDSDDNVYSQDARNYVVAQQYESEPENEYVIRGNNLILKCKIPSFVADFLQIVAWVDSDGQEYTPQTTAALDGKFVVLPSGELHIKDVRPEDEPLGSSAPKFPTESRMQTLQKQSGSSVAVVCPAQAHPYPNFRWYKFTDGSTREPVELNERVKQLGGTLIIREAKVVDSGKYLCKQLCRLRKRRDCFDCYCSIGCPVEPAVQTMDFGRPATFTCHYQGSPVKNVTWMKDGKRLQTTESVIRIDAVRREDKGMYQCFVRNDQDSAQSTSELKLGGRFDPPRLTFKFREEILQPGPTVSLKCKATGNPSPEIVWELDSKKVTNGERVSVGQYATATGEVVSHLNITNVHSNDGGLYKCTAISKVGNTYHTARLNVHGLPHVKPMEKAQVVAGETFQITCPVAGYPIDAVVWEKDNRVLPINRRQAVFPNGTLIIENVQRASDQGTYTCVARNAQGYTSRGNLEVQVMVKYKMVNWVWVVPPVIVPFSFGDEQDTVDAGASVQASCMVSFGDTPLTITWSFHGAESSTASQKGVTTTKIGSRISVLVIESVDFNHNGLYTCTAKNAAGSTDYMAKLIVNGKEITFPVFVGFHGVAGFSVFIIAPKIVPFSFGDEPLLWGTSAQSSCYIVEGDLPLQISWTFHGSDVTTHTQKGIQTSKFGQRSSIILIDPIRLTSKASALISLILILCTTHAMFEDVRHVIPPNIVPFAFGSETIEAGEMAQLQCIVSSGDAPIHITWSFHGKDSSTTKQTGVSTMKIGERSSLLIIDSVNSDLVGTYTCFARNAAGNTTYSTELKVNVSPRILPFSFGDKDEPLLWGTQAQATCYVAEGDTPLQISWAFHGSDISAQAQKGIQTTKFGQRSSIILIDPVEFSANFTCSAKNAAGTANYTAELIVQIPPSIMPFQFGGDSLEAGQMGQLNCIVISGDTPLHFTWSFHGKDSSTSKQSGVSTMKLGERSSMLMIDAVNSDHAGTYTCFVRNAAGNASYSAELRVNVLPNIVPFTFGSDTIEAGEMAQLQCMVSSGDAPLQITWSFHGKDTSTMTQKGVSTAKFGERSSLLVIDSVSSHHVGTYTCFARNAAGNSSHSTDLRVNVAPRIIPFTFGDEPLQAGEFKSLDCTIAEGDLPLSITWIFHGQQLSSQMGINTVRIGKRTNLLTIDAVAASHMGNYTCSASNSVASTNYTAQLTVHVPPKIVPFGGDEPSSFGDAVQLTCLVATGDLPLQLTWSFHGSGDSKQKQEGVSIMKIGTKSSLLIIESLQATHNGQYTCRASNNAGTDEYTATVVVNVPPKIMPFTFGEGESALNEGEVAQVQCFVSVGEVPLQITWSFHSSQDDKPQDGVTIMKLGPRSSVLMIDYVKASHAGSYSCRASNLAGTDEYTTTLVVNVPPRIVPFSFGEEPLEAGSHTTLTCTADMGDLPLKISWIFQGQESREVTAQMGIETQKFGKRTNMLSIENVAQFHMGNFTCVVTNVAGSTSHSAELIVQVPPRIVPFSFGDGDDPLEAGTHTSLQCLVDQGDTPLSISWVFHGQNYHPDGVETTKIGKETTCYLLKHCPPFHAGNYTCVSSNKAGQTNYTAVLVVQVPPHIVPFSFGEDDEPLQAGFHTSLQCFVDHGDTPLTISWIFHGKELSSQMGVETTKIGKRINLLQIEALLLSMLGQHMNLIIHSILELGYYTCVASNKAGQTNYTAVLVVQVPPRIVPFAFGDGDDPLEAGAHTSLQCFVDQGDSPLTISWIFHGKELSSQMGVETTKIGKRINLLQVESIAPFHAGNYTCVASNKAGQANYTAVLVVQVPPHILPFSFGEDYEPLQAGSHTSLQCLVDQGDTPLTISWVFHGQELSSQMGVETVKLGKRTTYCSIEALLTTYESNHMCYSVIEGNYTCVASNKAGQTNYTAVLVVQGTVLQ